MRQSFKILSACCLIAAVGWSAIASGDLIAHYTMEETSSPLVDQVGGELALAVDAGHNYGITGPPGFGNAVGVDSNGGWQLSVAESAELRNLANDMTVAAWAYIDSGLRTSKTGAASANDRIMGDDVAWDADGWSWGFRDGQMLFTKNGIIDAIDPTATLVPTDEWVHLAISVSSSAGIEFYLNGSSLGINGNTADNNTGLGNNGLEDPYGVGRSYGNAQEQWFPGNIDEVRVYDNVLTALEIFELANPGVGVFELEINRDTGAVALKNNSNVDRVISAIDITSPAGSLNPSGWKSVAGNYDADNDGTVDPVNNWTVFSSEAINLAEGSIGTATISAGQAAIDLGTAWAQSPFEDVGIVLLQEDGTIFSPLISFVGNGEQPFAVADLNFDGEIDELDWPIYRDGYREDLSGLSAAEAYRMGDLDSDGFNNVTDFALFKAAYDNAQGPGAFANMLASVPEPAAATLLVLGIISLGLRRRSRSGLAVVALIAVMGVTMVGPGAAEAQLPALVSNWTLDSNGNDSVGGHNGASTAVTFGQAGANGNTGSSAMFDGSTSTINVPYSADLNPDSFTITIWANPETTSAPHQSPITSRDDTAGSTGTHGYIIYNAPSGNWEFWTGDGVPGWPNLNAGPVVTNVWTHLAISFDAATNRKSVYLDGVLANSVTNQGYSPTGTEEQQNLHIGSGSDLGDQFFFTGWIDDVGIFNGILSQSEIQYVADNGVANYEPIRLKLEIDNDTGYTTLRNNSPVAIELDQYEILSASNSLDPASWSSLQDQDYEGSGPPNNTGDGWEELGTPVEGFLGEAFLQSSSSLGVGDSISLGNLHDTSVNSMEDLEFTYHLPDGGLVEGIVEYGHFPPDEIMGDYDGSGQVEQGDLDLVLLNWGDPWPPTVDGWVNDEPTDGKIDQNDLDGVLLKWGNTAAAASAQAVPEPSSGLVMLLGALTASGLWSSRRRKQARNDGGSAMNSVERIRIAAVTLVGICLLGSSTLMAAVTNDREYWFGEDGLEGPSQGAVLGSNNTSPLANGDTADSIGPTGAFLDLTQSGGPTYQDVSSGGLDRPGAAAGSFGAKFDGVDDRLTAIALNRPDELATLVLPDVYPLNYTGITVRGLQGWVYPDQAGIDAGGYQSIVFDTIFSGGPAINEQGQWTQTNSFHPSGTVGQVPATVSVTGDTWYHVMHHNYAADDPTGPSVVPGTGGGRPFTSVLYVDGIAVSSNNDNINTGGDAAFTGSLLVGVAEDGGEPETYINYFQGVIDDLEMYVYGDNTSDGGKNWGTFDLFADNEWIANEIAATVPGGVLTGGDINKDGSVNGDGTGSVASDDVSAFIAGWKMTKTVSGVHNDTLVGDWETWNFGDMNHDGITDVLDWHILRTHHPTPASLDLGQLLMTAGVPEPSMFVLVLLGALALLPLRRCR